MQSERILCTLLFPGKKMYSAFVSQAIKLLLKAFYFWLSAMSFNIWDKFANMKTRSGMDDNAKFLR